MEDLKVGIRGIVVCDDRASIRVQHQRRKQADVASRVGGGDALVAARAVGVVAVEDLQVAIVNRGVGTVVCDDREPTRVQHQGGRIGGDVRVGVGDAVVTGRSPAVPDHKRGEQHGGNGAGERSDKPQPVSAW